MAPVLVVVVVAAACTSAGGTTSRVPAAGGRASTGDLRVGRPSTTVVGSDDVPRLWGDFADPSIVTSRGVVYAYSTNTPRANVPVLRATTTGPPTYLGDALPTLPAWSAPGRVWAPSVAVGPDGTDDLYYTTLDRASGRQCVSVATAGAPAGPFVDRSSHPLVCQVALGGSIDPSVVQDGTTRYLVWKSDGNCCHLPSQIWSAPLRPDGLALDGAPTSLLRSDEPWEDGVVEGPSMAAAGAGWDLFYSGGRWDTKGYGMGMATCASPVGPCHDVASTPFLASSPTREGPGGGEIHLTRRGVPILVFAAWTNGRVGYRDGGERSLFVDVLDLSGPTPRVV